jgi:GTP cyclohydrolase II
MQRAEPMRSLAQERVPQSRPVSIGAHGAGPEPVRVRTNVPLPFLLEDGRLADSRIVTFDNVPGQQEHVALLVGPWREAPVPLVRLHSECLTGDAFGSARCDCGPQLRQALAEMAVPGGVVIYLRQEGRGIGLYNKIDAYALQDQGMDTFQANIALDHAPDERDFTVAGALLRSLGITRCELLSNNPDKREQLIRSGVDVCRQRPTGVFETAINRRYLQSKVDQAGHGIRLTRFSSPEEQS